MKMAFHHDESSHHHRFRTLAFALLVIIIAMMISALTFLRVHPASLSEDVDDSPFTLVALQMVDGEEVFNRVCTTCHTVDRPTDMETEPIAPPMKMIVRRYTMSTDSPEEAHTRIVEWLKKPDAEKSLMPAMAIEHHGLMPPVVLTEEERTAVAEYVLTLAEPGEGMMQGKMHQMGEGEGMMHQNGDGQGMQGMQHQMGNNGQGMMQGKMHQMGEGEGMKGCNHQMDVEEGQKCPMHQNGEGEGMKGCNHENGQGAKHQHGQSKKG